MVLIVVTVGCLNSSTGNKEPLIDRGVNGGWWVVLASREFRGIYAVWVAEDGGIGPGGGLLDSLHLQPRVGNPYKEIWAVGSCPSINLCHASCVSRITS